MIEELENRRWKVLESHYIAREGDWFTVRKEKVQLPNGHIVPSWYIIDYPDWINVIAITKQGEFVMISQYRHAIAQTSYELVAGIKDKTDASPMDAAKRELLEESGYGGGKWTPFMKLCPNPTSNSNYSYTFLAEGVEKVSEQHTEESEDIRVYLFSLEEIRELLEKGMMLQALQAAPLWKYLAMIDRKGSLSTK